jgi:peptidoglycan/xylan/chitin deacetylase (PgdA/CDA1 family)
MQWCLAERVSCGPACRFAHTDADEGVNSDDRANGFWPDGARLAVSVSMQFEAGGQPVSGAGGPITEPILPGFPDLGQNSFYEYGAREGVPRILDLLDKHAIKMTSFMIGDAVRRHPDVAAEIVRRGHEAGAHGRSWQRQYQLPRPQETEWIADSVHAIEQATGTRPSVRIQQLLDPARGQHAGDLAGARVHLPH